MLLSEIVYNLKNLHSSGNTSDDFPLSNDQIVFIINYVRSRLAKEQIEKQRNIDSFVQNLGKVKLIRTDLNECCEKDVCILRTEEKIPKPLETTSKGLLITYVGTSFNVPFQKTYYEHLNFVSYQAHTGNKPRYFYSEEYIYIINAPTINFKNVVIRGVFENPYDVNKFITCDCPDNKLNCDESLNFEYPMDSSLLQTLNQLILQSEFKWSLIIKNDLENNTKDDIQPKGKI